MGTLKNWLRFKRTKHFSTRQYNVTSIFRETVRMRSVSLVLMHKRYTNSGNKLFTTKHKENGKVLRHQKKKKKKEATTEVLCFIRRGNKRGNCKSERHNECVYTVLIRLFQKHGCKIRLILTQNPVLNLIFWKMKERKKRITQLLLLLFSTFVSMTN